MTAVGTREQHPDADSAPVKSFCVLVIEGHAGQATAVRAVLSESTAADFAVLRAPTLDSGVDALRLDDIDVVLICDDLLAPEGVAAVLAAAGSRPVLALTRSTDPGVATRLIDAGLHDVIRSGPAASDDLGWATVRSIHRAGAVGERTDTKEDRAPGPLAPTTTPEAAAVIRRGVAEARTPLSALIDLLDLLTSAWDALADENKLSMLSSIRSYVAMIEQRTGDLLSMASTADEDRPSTLAPVPPAPQPVGLAQAVARAMSLTGVDASTDIDPNVVVWVDPRHLDEMLTALLTRVAHRSLPPVHATATHGGTSVRLSLQGGGAPTAGGGGWSLLHPSPVRVVEVDGLDRDLETAQRLAEVNGGLAGADEHPGSAWLRLPTTPPDPALV